MATINKTGRSVVTEGAVPHSGLNKFYVMEQVVDLTADAIVENDVYQCLAVPANTLVQKVELEIVEPGVGTTLTMDVGDGAGVDSWDADVDGKGVAGTITASAVGTDAYAAAASMGKRYTAGDSIDVVMDVATAITAGPKFKIRALCVDLN